MTRAAGLRAALAGLGALSLAGYALFALRVAGSGEATLPRYVALFAALHVLYLLAAWVVLRRGGGERGTLALVLGLGLLFRLMLLPSPVVLSSDVFRYLWDGRVQLAGINPYLHPPAAPELATLRDATVHPRINRPDKPTVYPPGAQAAFRLSAWLWPQNVAGWRFLLLASEVLTVALLLVLLRRMGAPPAMALVYAWAPLPIMEGVQAGHVDLLLLPPLLLALLSRQEGKMGLAGAALGLAVLVKLYPAVLLLAWRRPGQWRLPAACAAVVAAGYLPYAWGVGLGVVGFLPEYFSSGEDFNVGLRHFLTEGLGLSGEVWRGIVMLLLLALLAVLLGRVGARLTETPEGILVATLGAVGLYLLLVPTAMHPWYVIWVVPLLAVRPSAAWLWFSGAVAVSYLGYTREPTEIPLWLRCLEFLPLYALLLREWWGAGSAPVPAGWRPGPARGAGPLPPRP